MRERMHDLPRNAIIPASPTNSLHHHQRTPTTEMYFKIWTCNLDLLRNLNLEFPSLSIKASLQCLLIFFLLASPLAVWRRIPKEWKGLTRFLIDDGFFVAALTTEIIYIGLTLLSIPNIDGISTTPINLQGYPRTTLSKALEYHFLAEIFYILATTFLRISLVISLIPFTTVSNFALLKRLNTSIPAILLTSILFVCVHANAIFLTVLLQQCRPVEYFWTRWLGAKGGWCVVSDAIEWYSARYAIVEAVSGITLFALLAWVIKKNATDEKSRCGLKIAATVGCLSSLMTLIRLPSIRKMPTSADFVTDSMPIVACSILEIGLGMLAIYACSFPNTSRIELLDHPIDEEKLSKEIE